ncbi:MAG: TauD/TfdA family dioxygenase [Rhodospirillales bacterium]
MNNFTKSPVGELPVVIPFDAALGAEVSNINLSNPLREDQFEVIEKAFVEHKVLVFRNQPLTDDQHLAFAARFGPLEGHINTPTRHKRLADVQVFSNVNEDGSTTGYHPELGTYVWHTDKSYVAEPSLTTVLRSPAIASLGGDTMFTNTQAAYEDLDPETRHKIAGLKAEHSWKRSREKVGEKPATAEQIAAAPPVQHPIVRTHPITGKKGIYVGSHASHIPSLEYDAGVELLKQLELHATQEQYIYRHKWQVNDVLMWDNRSTMHCVTPYDAAKEKRTVHRVVVKGDRPF